MAETVQVQTPGIGFRSRDEHNNNDNKRRVDMWETPNRSTLRARSTKAELIAGSGYGNTLTHTTGFDTVRATPETTLRPVTGEVIKIEAPKFDQELVAHFTKDLQDDIEGLIKMNQDSGNYEDFVKQLRDSGHDYYLPLFENLTKVKEGTGGRIRDVDIKALKDFMSKDSNLALAVEIAQKKLQEEALAALVELSVGPNELTAEPLADEEIALEQKGKLGHRAARRAGKFWRTRLDSIYGRDNDDDPGIPNRRNTRRATFQNTRGMATVTIGGTTIVLGAVGTMLGGPLLGLLGAATPGGAAAIYNSFNRGETLNVNLSKDVLLAAQADLTSANLQIRANAVSQENWMKQMRGLSVSDYEANGNQVRIRTDRTPETRINRYDLRNRIVSASKAILEYQEANGIPSRLRRPDTSNWLLEGSLTNLRAPQHGTDFERRTMQLFDANHGGIRDITGNAREVLRQAVDATGALLWENPPANTIPRQARDVNNNQLWDINPAGFDANNLDIVGNMRRYQEAESKVLGEMVNQAFQDIIDGKTDYKQRIFDDIKILRGGTGTEAQNEQKKEKHEKQKAILEGDKTGLSELVGTFGDYQQNLASSRRDLEEATLRVTETTGKVLTDPPSGNAEEALRRVLSADDPTAKVTIDGQEITSLVDEGRKLQDVVTKRVNDVCDTEYTRTVEPEIKAVEARQDMFNRVQNALDRLTDQNAITRQQTIVSNAHQALEVATKRLNEAKDNLNNLRQLVRDELRIGPEFEEQFKAFEEKKELVRNMRQEITDAKQEERDQEQSLRNTEVAGKRDAIKAEAATKDAYTELTALGITEADLQTDDLNTLMGKINAQNATNPDAWAAGGNNSSENRMLVLQARAEAKARGIPAHASYDAVTGIVSEVDMLTLDTAQIQSKLGASISLPDTAIDDIKKQAAQRFTARKTALTQLIKDTEKQMKRETTSAAVEKLTPAHLDALKAVVENYGGIREGIMNLTDTAPGGALDQFLSMELIDNVPNSPEWKHGKNRTVAEDNIYKLLFAKAPRSADHGNEHGPQGADAVQQDVLKREAFVKLAIERFGLPETMPDPAKFPITDPPTAPTFNPNDDTHFRTPKIADVIGLVRLSLGLSSGFTGSQAAIETYLRANPGIIPLPERNSITRGQLASFLTETVIFGHLAPQVQANV